MENTKIYPFSNPIFYQQKSEKEQLEYVENHVNHNKNDLITPTNYRKIITTDKTIPGISDEDTLNKSNVEVIETASQKFEKPKTFELVTKSFQLKQGYWGTVFATAGILMLSYFVYHKFLNKNKK